MKSVALRLVTTSVLAIVLGLAGLAVAQDNAAPPDVQSDVEARAEFEAGRDAYEHAEFASALVHFDRAYALSPRPKLLFNIARSADGDGQRLRAITAYEQYLERMPDADNRDFAAARLRSLREQGSREEPARRVEPAQATPVVHEPQDYERDRRLWQRLRVHAGLYLGVGRERTASSNFSMIRSSEYTASVGPALGFQLGTELVLNRWLGVGAELRYLTFRGTSELTSESSAIELLARPTVRYRFSNEHLEAYAGLPIGIAFPRLPASPFDGEWSPRPGLSIALVAGLLYPVASRFALALEVGYGRRSFSAYLLDGDYEPKFSAKLRTASFALNAVIPLSPFAR